MLPDTDTKTSTSPVAINGPGAIESSSDLKNLQDMFEKSFVPAFKTELHDIITTDLRDSIAVPLEEVSNTIERSGSETRRLLETQLKSIQEYSKISLASNVALDATADASEDIEDVTDEESRDSTLTGLATTVQDLTAVAEKIVDNEQSLSQSEPDVVSSIPEAAIADTNTEDSPKNTLLKILKVQESISKTIVGDNSSLAKLLKKSTADKDEVKKSSIDPKNSKSTYNLETFFTNLSKKSSTGADARVIYEYLKDKFRKPEEDSILNTSSTVDSKEEIDQKVEDSSKSAESQTNTSEVTEASTAKQLESQSIDDSQTDDAADDSAVSLNSVPEEEAHSAEAGNNTLESEEALESVIADDHNVFVAAPQSIAVKDSSQRDYDVTEDFEKKLLAAIEDLKSSTTQLSTGLVENADIIMRNFKETSDIRDSDAISSVDVKMSSIDESLKVLADFINTLKKQKILTEGQTSSVRVHVDNIPVPSREDFLSNIGVQDFSS